MRKLEPTKKFRQDYKAVQRQSVFNQKEFEYVVNRLANDFPLEEKYNDHPLRGKYEGARECHIKPDWLLVYAKPKGKMVLILMRTGSHAKLFGM